MPGEAVKFDVPKAGNALDQDSRHLSKNKNQESQIYALVLVSKALPMAVEDQQLLESPLPPQFIKEASPSCPTQFAKRR